MNRALRRKLEAINRHQSIPTYPASHWANEGLKAAQSEDWRMAIHCFRKAAQLSPNEAPHWNNLAAAYCRAGDYLAAQESAQEAMALDPSYIESAFNYATALKMNGDIEAAIGVYEGLLIERPDDLDSMVNLAACYMNQNDVDRAEYLYQQALNFAPSDPLLLANMAGLLYQRGKVEEAIPYLERALPIANYGVHYNYGLCCFNLGRLMEAKNHLQKAVKIHPDSADAQSSLSAILLLLGENEAALVAADRAIKISPDNIAMLNNYAAALDANGQEGEAMQISSDVLNRIPGQPGALVNMAILLRRQHRWEEVIHYLHQAIAAEPDNPSPHFYLCGTHFLLGHLDRAWEEFRWRWQKKGERPRSRFVVPKWRGEDLSDKSILLWGEQGIGDEIMFAGMIPDLKNSAKRVIIECEERLIPIFQRSFPWAETQAHPMDAHGPALDRTARADIDVEASFGDLGEYLRHDQNAFPKVPFYLSADKEKSSLLRHEYLRYAKGKKIIGISWRSGNLMSGARRTAELPLWKRLFGNPEAFFVSLQYGDVSDAGAFPLYIDPLIDAKKDMDFFAAQVAAMDLIISIDNTTIHMAGALGKPVWALLSYHADVRWGLKEGRTPWYPSMRLFRQEKTDQWSNVMDQAADELVSWLEN